MPAVTIISHRDGDVLNRHDGTETAESITVTVRGTCPPGSQVTVNGLPAIVTGGEFACDVALTRKRNFITACAGDSSHEILVLWNKGSFKRYRFSIDDNILWLRDLGLHPEDYNSIFDQWFLGFWRDIHREYGTKVHINIYYQTELFDLTQMPDKWKDEWIENSPWLHLSFHALQNNPNRIYRNATYSQIAHDYDLVCGHIRRFAGNEVISNTTTVHWAECPKDASLALRDRGIENLIGLFWVKNGVCTTGYYHSPEQCEYCHSRDAWHDRDTGLTFVSCDQVVNSWSVEEIGPMLDEREQSVHTCEMIELLIHEQYFWQETGIYQPTIKDKVRTAVEWVSHRGYEPVFWGDGFLGVPEA